MTPRILYLAWQDQKTRRWFPVGRLNANTVGSLYEFQYLQGASDASIEAGFSPLEDFPSFNCVYRSAELFPFFKNRVISPGRPDFLEYLAQLDLPDGATPAQILAVGGGGRATDAFEVFPKLEKAADETFTCRFFLHGGRYVPASAQARASRLKPGEELIVALELNNPVTTFALQMQTSDYEVIGWAPRYLVDDFVNCISRSKDKYRARVVKVNPAPAPSKQRVLLELRSQWPDVEPMADGPFKPFSTP